MADESRRIKIDSPEYWKFVSGSEYEPQWAIKVLLDPRGDELDELVTEGEYPILGRVPDEPVTPERALGLFDKDSLGWLPLWFPREIEGRRLSPEERVAWFDKVLERYAQTEWPPSGSLSSRQRAVALSLLHMLYELELNGRIPTPHKL